MKRIFSLLLCCLIMLGSLLFCNPEPVIEAAARDITITVQINNPVMMVNGSYKPLDDQNSKPAIIDGKTMVPLRPVVEELGGQVEWNGHERKATLTHFGKVIELTMDDSTAYLNGQPALLEAAPVILNGKTMVPIRYIAESFGYQVFWNSLNKSVIITNTGSPNAGIIVVLDAGHGRSTSSMTDQEKIDNGWSWNPSTNNWGCWHHWKYGTLYPDCQGEGCSHWGNCWYSMTNGDRTTEPEINMDNVWAAQKYLQQMGYHVRLARSNNYENPSLTKRISSCYYQNNLQSTPDASCFICVHSNAGGASGSAYIELSGNYDQPTLLGSSSEYVNKSNYLGSLINDRIVSSVALPRVSPITFEPNLIIFNKCPVACGYLEIGFFDNGYDLSILKNQSDAIGHSIARGINDFMKSGVITGPAIDSEPCPSSIFNDVDTEQNSHYPIDFVLQKGLMTGTSPNTFEPLGLFNRAMAAMIFYRLEGSPAISGNSRFADTAADVWYGSAVNWADENGLVTGYENGTFGPSNPITREQLITILYRYAKYKGFDCDLYSGINLNVVDASAISPYAVPAMKWAYSHGIAEISNNSLSPQALADRLEVATILMRFARLPQNPIS